MAPAGLRLDSVLEATGGRALTPAPGGLALASVSIDSRTLTPGALFVAVRGPRFDGHDFLADARAKGATAALVEREPEAGSGHAHVRVADTTRALSDLARHVRQRAGLPVVAVMSLVVVLPTEPVTATTGIVALRRTWRARSASALVVPGTRTS